MAKKLTDDQFLNEANRKLKLHETQLERTPVGRDAIEERTGIDFTISHLKRELTKRPGIAHETNKIIEKLRSL